MRMNDLDWQQAELLDLITSAIENKHINMEAEEMDDFLAMADIALSGKMTKPELAELTRLTQSVVRLPLYTTRQAAAWCGVTQQGIVYAINNGLLNALKPGHDLLVEQSELKRYAGARRYSLD
jgi:hypothetical protein